MCPKYAHTIGDVYALHSRARAINGDEPITALDLAQWTLWAIAALHPTPSRAVEFLTAATLHAYLRDLTRDGHA